LQTLNARGVFGFSDEKYLSRNRTKERSGKTMVTTRWKRGRYSDCSCVKPAIFIAVVMELLVDVVAQF
jgi:hypothetical protein